MINEYYFFTSNSYVPDFNPVITLPVSARNGPMPSLPFSTVTLSMPEAVRFSEAVVRMRFEYPRNIFLLPQVPERADRFCMPRGNKEHR